MFGNNLISPSFGAFLVYIIPSFYGVILIYTIILENTIFLFVLCCITFSILAIFTTIVGIYGIIYQDSKLLKSLVPLVLMDNILTIGFSMYILFYKSFTTFISILIAICITTWSLPRLDRYLLHLDTKDFRQSNSIDDVIST